MLPVCILACLAVAHADVNSPPLSARGDCAIRKVTVSADTVPRYGRLELTVDLSASYDNPYDPDQVDLAATFTAPSGKTAVVPGFFYQGYRRAPGDPDTPILACDGEPCWRARFAPTEVGPYRCVVRLRNQSAGVMHEAAAAPVAFRCVSSGSPGFIRVTNASQQSGGPRYFAFDSGAPFYPVGQNTQNDWIDYRHTRTLAEAGADCARSWLFCHWTWLEWSPMTPTWAAPGHWIRGYGGAGAYNQGLAWIADEYLSRCERDGIRLMLCIGAAHEVNAGDDVGRWAGHPYNRATGGFLDKPEEYWSNPRARQLARNRLRYIAARYGYSTAVWAWEFWNELGDAGPDVTAWHREMGDYLRSVDPNRHLLTTSTWQPEPDRLAPIWRLPEIDFTQSHIYSPSPAFEPIVAAHLRQTELAYDYFLRTARLDLDDLHGNTWMGVHTACLAGAWQCVVLGFGGVRWYDGALSLDPVLPPQWASFAFSLVWHGTRLHVTVREAAVTLRADAPLTLTFAGQEITVVGEMTVSSKERGAGSEQ